MKGTSKATWGAKKQVKSMKIPMARAQSNMYGAPAEGQVHAIPVRKGGDLGPKVEGSSSKYTFRKVVFQVGSFVKKRREAVVIVLVYVGCKHAEGHWDAIVRMGAL
jgi:hypothetical protein